MTEASTTTTNAPLPEPRDGEPTDVVIYDGHCRFCTGQVRRIARWDSAGRVSFLSLHDPRVAERYPDLTYEMMMDRMYVIDTQGGRHGGAAGFRYLTRRLPWLWPLVPLMHVPFSI